MTSTVQNQMEISAILNLVPYLDTDFNYPREITLGELVRRNEEKFTNKDGSLDPTFKLLKEAVNNNDAYASIELVDQSSTNDTKLWTDDLIQGCTFRDADGNYYVAFRGTGDGRWPDNGEGMTAPSTEMQEAAKAYFDKMAEKYLVDAHIRGKDIIVTGHSKGGNEAQYVYMTSEYDHIIDKCYSMNGQGFSDEARTNFKNQYGNEYEEKLKDMYSICGQNDFVHDLGYVIIPEENTYFVETTGEGPTPWHALENMLSNENGEYIGLQWDYENGVITNGEQGEIGKLAKKISESMMKLDDEDLNGAAIAIMSLIDPCANDEILGSLQIDSSDYIDLIAEGAPIALQALLTTEEGHKALAKFLNIAAEKLYDKWGTGGVIGGFAVGALVLAVAIPKVVPLALGIMIGCKIADMAMETIEKIKKLYGKVKKCVLNIRDAVIKTIEKIIEKMRSMTDGYDYAVANPHVIVDIYKLLTYADKLNIINGRLNSLDLRLDKLYGKVGWKDLYDLLRGDAKISWSYRLNRCASYLSETAEEFSKAERNIQKQLQ